MTCGCVPVWLTSVSVPVSAEEVVTGPCSCCGASAGKRCAGGRAGWLPQILKKPGEPRAHVEVCPVRLEAGA